MTQQPLPGKGMRVLHLTLKKRWFDMIASGEKKEEYRDWKLYWRNRLHPKSKSGTGRNEDGFLHFDAVKFSNGYNNPDVFLIECLGIDIGSGNPDWGAEMGKKYFVIKLGEIIK